jgi:hypothetical protein
MREPTVLVVTIKPWIHGRAARPNSGTMKRSAPPTTPVSNLMSGGIRELFNNVIGWRLGIDWDSTLAEENPTLRLRPPPDQPEKQQ